MPMMDEREPNKDRQEQAMEASGATSRHAFTQNEETKKESPK